MVLSSLLLISWSQGPFGPLVDLRQTTVYKLSLCKGSSPASDDSQDDSQPGGRRRTRPLDHGLLMRTVDRQHTFVDGPGRQPRGLQNRFRGAVEASWVGSIPIHPRHFRQS
jgi:hypothetical protein